MKTLAALAVLLIAVGCNNPDAPVSPTETSGPTPTTSSTATSAPTSAPTASATPSPTAIPSVNTQVIGENLRRTFQLKDLKQISLRVGKAHIKVWLMDIDQKRAEGMMWLTDKEVRADEGMLFVFSKRQELSFWMQNTLIPLDIMYVDENKKIINIAAGKPLDESPIPAARPGQFVIEMKKGSAKRLGIKAGDSVGIPDDVKAKD